MLRLAVATALLALGACATKPDVPFGEGIAWRCDGGASFTTRNTTHGNAEISTGDHIYRLPAAPAAGSAAHYTDGQVDLSVRGVVATLTGAAGGPYANCKS